MKIRAYQPSDFSALESMFRQQGFEYELPDFDSPLFMSKAVLEDDRPVMAIASRLTAEEYFLMDRNWGTPEQKWQAFLHLHEAARKDLYSKGLEDCYCWLPPQVEKSFGRRLMRLDWAKNKWPSFTRSLKEPTEDLRKPCVSTVEYSST